MRSVRCFIIVSVLVGAAPGVQAAPRTRAKIKLRIKERTSSGTRSPGMGQVTYATKTLAFVDHGSTDGVAVGQVLNLIRDNRPVGSCTVVSVGEHAASCGGSSIQRGDQFKVVATARHDEPEPRRVWVEATPAAPPAELNTADAAFVHDKGGAKSKVSFSTLFAGFDHRTWAVITSSNGPYHAQRVSVRAQQVRIWGGLRLNAALSVMNFSRRPEQYRSLLGSPVLLVQQANIGWFRSDTPVTGWLGRGFSRHTPGLSLLDGAQVAYRSTESGMEIGAYGGLLTEPTQLGFATDRWTAGAYWAHYVALGQIVIQPELRAGFTHRSKLGDRVELGVTANADIAHAFDARLMVQMGIGAGQAPAFVDAAALDLVFEPIQSLKAQLGARYQGWAFNDMAVIGGPMTSPNTFHTDARVSLDALQWLSLTALGGLARDQSSTLVRGYVGGELIVPLLQSRVLTSGRYWEEFGWLKGRGGSIDVSVRVAQLLRLGLRGSYSYYWQASEAAFDDGAVSVSAQFKLGPWIQIFGSATARSPVLWRSTTTSLPAGFWGRVGVSGEL